MWMAGTTLAAYSGSPGNDELGCVTSNGECSNEAVKGPNWRQIERKSVARGGLDGAQPIRFKLAA
jgi:hypothetical protein